MWIRVTDPRGERDAETCVSLAEAKHWLSSKRAAKFVRVELLLTAREFYRSIMHTWITLQVLPRLRRHGELRIEVMK